MTAAEATMGVATIQSPDARERAKRFMLRPELAALYSWKSQYLAVRGEKFTTAQKANFTVVCSHCILEFPVCRRVDSTERSFYIPGRPNRLWHNSSYYTA